MVVVVVKESVHHYYCPKIDTPWSLEVIFKAVTEVLELQDVVASKSIAPPPLYHPNG